METAVKRERDWNIFERKGIMSTLSPDQRELARLLDYKEQLGNFMFLAREAERIGLQPRDTGRLVDRVERRIARLEARITAKSKLKTEP